MNPNPFRQRAKIRIGTLGAIRSEMGRIYKAGVAGDLPWQDATRAAYVLNLIATLDQGALLDQRVGELERRLAEPHPASRQNGAGSYAQI